VGGNKWTGEGARECDGSKTQQTQNHEFGWLESIGAR